MPDHSVSILTCSFNQARWLGTNIRSVREQTHREVEHIIADGDSSDGSLQLLRHAAKVDPRLTFWSRADRGQSDALNQAYRVSQGAIIGWLNSDDALFDPHALAAVVTAFDADPRVDVVYGHVALVNESDLILEHMWVPAWHKSLLPWWGFLRQPGVFFRRALLDRCGFVDERFDYTMDGELWHRLVRANARFRRVDRLLAIDRHQHGRKSIVGKTEAATEARILERMYHIPRGGAQRPFQLSMHVLGRFAGAAHLLSHHYSDSFFMQESILTQLSRQLWVPRSRMPIDS